MAARAQRYTAVAIVLHWAIAVAILFMIPMGLWMHESSEHGDVSAQLFRAYQLHKSIGLTVLALSLVRLGWRLLNPPPAHARAHAGLGAIRRDRHALGLLRADDWASAYRLALCFNRLVDPRRTRRCRWRRIGSASSKCRLCLD